LHLFAGLSMRKPSNFGAISRKFTPILRPQWWGQPSKFRRKPKPAHKRSHRDTLSQPYTFPQQILTLPVPAKVRGGGG